MEAWKLHSSIFAQLPVIEHTKNYVLDLEAGVHAGGSTQGYIASASDGKLRAYVVQEGKLVCVSTLDTLAAKQGGILKAIRCMPRSPALVMTASSLGNIAIWDMRTGKQTHHFRAPPALHTADVAWDDVGLAAGVGDNILVWDIRRENPLAVLEDVHTDDVLALRWHPKGHLFSGGSDGLVCSLNMSVGDVDDVLEGVMNEEQDVVDISFFGEQGEGLAVRTTVEGFSLWNIASEDRVVHCPDGRKVLHQSAGVEANYLVRLMWTSGMLWLVSGTFEGMVHVSNVDLKQGELIPQAVLCDGHGATVRCVGWKRKELPMCTGGEDGKLALWSGKQEVSSSFGKIRPERAKVKKNPWDR